MIKEPQIIMNKRELYKYSSIPLGQNGVFFPHFYLAQNLQIMLK
jgi:hypothetical protein